MAITNFTKIAYTAPDLNRPGAGAEDWHNQNRVNIPTEGTNTPRLDAYFRSQLTWAMLEKAQGQYDLNPLINLLNGCITKRQRMSFGIMTVYHDNEPVVISYDGFRSSYPQYLHNLMQSESVKDWHTSSGWVPNYNSQHYIGRLRALHTAVNNLLETGSFNGVKYKDVISSIDVRGYGNYGEWHNGGLVDLVSQIPSGAHATTATLKAIIDAHTSAFPNFQLSIIMTAFDGNFLQHTRTAAEVGVYSLTTKNTYNKLGWRRDNWGAGDGTGDTYIDDLLIDNTRSWNGIVLKDLIMNVWKYAPITGEPMNSTSNSFSEFEAQVRKYHANSWGNGNITSSPSTTIKDNFRAASKAAGYRIVVESFDVPPPVGKSVTIKMNWKNEGIAPPYNNWDIVFDLVKSGIVTNLGKSLFKLRGFQPAGIASTSVDTLSKDVADGTYDLRFKVIDPTGFAPPMPIFITAPKGADGSYSLGNVILSGGVVVPPVNKPPVVSAGADKEITLPTNTITLAGTASDPDGIIASRQWSMVSGPVAATIVSPTNLATIINFTKDGVYKFRLVVTDNAGATSVDEVDVIVKPAVVVPPTQKTVVEVRNVSTVSTVSTVVYSDGSTEVFPKP